MQSTSELQVPSLNVFDNKCVNKPVNIFALATLKNNEQQNTKRNIFSKECSEGITKSNPFLSKLEEKPKSSSSNSLPARNNILTQLQGNNARNNSAQNRRKLKNSILQDLKHIKSSDSSNIEQSLHDSQPFLAVDLSVVKAQIQGQISKKNSQQANEEDSKQKDQDDINEIIQTFDNSKTIVLNNVKQNQFMPQREKLAFLQRLKHYIDLSNNVIDENRTTKFITGLSKQIAQIKLEETESPQQNQTIRKFNYYIQKYCKSIKQKQKIQSQLKNSGQKETQYINRQLRLKEQKVNCLAYYKNILLSKRQSKQSHLLFNQDSSLKNDSLSSFSSVSALNLIFDSTQSIVQKDKLDSQDLLQRKKKILQLHQNEFFRIKKKLQSETRQRQRQKKKAKEKIMLEKVKQLNLQSGKQDQQHSTVRINDTYAIRAHTKGTMQKDKGLNLNIFNSMNFSSSSDDEQKSISVSSSLIKNQNSKVKSKQNQVQAAEQSILNSEAQNRQKQLQLKLNLSKFSQRAVKKDLNVLMTSKFVFSDEFLPVICGESHKESNEIYSLTFGKGDAGQQAYAISSESSEQVQDLNFSISANTKSKSISNVASKSMSNHKSQHYGGQSSNKGNMSKKLDNFSKSPQQQFRNQEDLRSLCKQKQEVNSYSQFAQFQGSASKRRVKDHQSQQMHRNGIGMTKSFYIPRQQEKCDRFPRKTLRASENRGSNQFKNNRSGYNMHLRFQSPKSKNIDIRLTKDQHIKKITNQVVTECVEQKRESNLIDFYKTGMVDKIQQMINEKIPELKKKNKDKINRQKQKKMNLFYFLKDGSAFQQNEQQNQTSSSRASFAEVNNNYSSSQKNKKVNYFSTFKPSQSKEDQQNINNKEIESSSSKILVKNQEELKQSQQLKNSNNYSNLFSFLEQQSKPDLQAEWEARYNKLKIFDFYNEKDDIKDNKISQTASQISSSLIIKKACSRDQESSSASPKLLKQSAQQKLPSFNAPQKSEQRPKPKHQQPNIPSKPQSQSQRQIQPAVQLPAQSKTKQSKPTQSNNKNYNIITSGSSINTSAKTAQQKQKQKKQAHDIFSKIKPNQNLFNKGSQPSNKTKFGQPSNIFSKGTESQPQNSKNSNANTIRNISVSHQTCSVPAPAPAQIGNNFESFNPNQMKNAQNLFSGAANTKEQQGQQQPPAMRTFQNIQGKSSKETHKPNVFQSSGSGNQNQQQSSLQSSSGGSLGNFQSFGPALFSAMTGQSQPQQQSQSNKMLFSESQRNPMNILSNLHQQQQSQQYNNGQSNNIFSNTQPKNNFATGITGNMSHLHTPTQMKTQPANLPPSYMKPRK